jgi:NADH:ubiquinone reductase (H+-translocating)
MPDRPNHRVVIVGSGFGGLFAARALRRAPVEVTIIDRTNHHLFQPLLYQVATGILSEGEIAPATREVLRRHRHTRVQLAEVTGIDLHRRVVTATQGERMMETPYDSLIVAAGVQAFYYGHDEFSRWAPAMKSIDDALELRGRIFGAFEMAEIETDEDARRAWLTFVVVGGGPTGVEMAGQIAELSHRALRRNFRSIDPTQARVILFEGGERVLASFGERLSLIATRDLGRLGVEVATRSTVTGMDQHGIAVRHADGTTERIEARTKVWAAGMVASPLARMLADASGAGVDRMGRVRVLPDCSLPGHPEVFAVGDMMTLDDLPGMAEVAMQTAMHAARLIKQRLKGDHSDKPFRYRDLGSLAVISRFRAVAKVGRLSVGGFIGWFLWLVVHLTFLTGFKNRFGALARWAVSFVGRGRAERTITFQQVVAREAITASGISRPVGSDGGPAADLPGTKGG